MNAAVTITPFAARAASDVDYAALNHFQNTLRAERLPDDPPIPLTEAVTAWRNLPAMLDVFWWVARDAYNTIVAKGEIEMLRTNDNTHLADFMIQVLPVYRQQGLGKKLLKLLAETAQRENRRIMQTWTADTWTVGDVTMEKLGAKKGATRHTNQLTLSELNHALVTAWLKSATETAQNFELGLWVGPYPAAQIQDVVVLNEAMNGEPRDELDLEDVHKSPDEIRAWEQQLFTRGTERWSLYARERATGQIAGYSEVFWNPNRPEHLNQGATGVIPHFRKHGLGRWLKAAMLEKILRERPQVKYIRTGNADSNAAMLKINYALGFKPYQAHNVWQIETEKVLVYMKP